MVRPLLILMFVVLWGSHAAAFSVRVVIDGQPTRWQEPTIPYYLQYAGSDNLSPEESVDAVRQAFEAWRSIECSSVDFEEQGDAPNPNVTVLTGNNPDGVNSVVWIEDEKWTLGKWVLGVTGPIITHGGYLVEADIAFNGYHLTWTTDGKGGTDLESVAVHEIGHMFGMQHNLGPYNLAEPPTMTPNILPQLKSRTPELDDEMCACFLYPSAGTWTCETDFECPKILGQTGDGQDTYIGAFVCDQDSHLCLDPKVWKDTANIGEACSFDSTCVGDLFCHAWKGAGVCSKHCDLSEQNCDEAFVCEALPQFPLYGVCVPEGGEAFAPGSGPAGCVGSGVCQDGDVCLPLPDATKKLCTSVCDLSLNDCPEGEACWDYGAGKPTGACFSLDLWPAGEVEMVEESVEPAPESEIIEGTEADGAVEVNADTGQPVEAEVGQEDALTPASDTNGCNAQRTAPVPALVGLLLLLPMGWYVRRKDTYRLPVKDRRP